MALKRQIEELLQKISVWLPEVKAPPDWQKQKAALWRVDRFGSHLYSYDEISATRLEDMLCIDQQKAALEANTRQFLQGLPANNVLLWGSRGSGKSSLVQALLHKYGDQGLRLIESTKEGLLYLPELIDQIKTLPYRFIVFSDDLSFEAEDHQYKALKSALEGSVFSASANVLIYATSNRRHLLPEYMSDNLQTEVTKTEIHHSGAVEEKISLSDRFGLWLAFRAFNQEQYLSIVSHWIAVLGAPYQLSYTEDARPEALQWALHRGSRSGRIAHQFARYWVGKKVSDTGAAS